MILIILLISTAILSFVITLCIRYFALAANVIDIPNNRSSHTNPTPRAGGVAISVSFLISLKFLNTYGAFTNENFMLFLITGCIIALVGLIDDCCNIPPKWKLLSHFLVASLASFWLESILFSSFFKVQLGIWIFVHTFIIIYLIWILNLYNFMDGIDGIASVEAITVCLSGSILYLISGKFLYAIPLLILLASVIGFLFLNFPTAKIFMGDTGSCFLGITLGLFSLQSFTIEPTMFYSWLIFLGIFITDSTYTLLIRLLRRETFYEAHRDHAYQHAARHYGTHRFVTLSVGIINIIFLLPIALLVGLQLINGIFGLLIAYLPLVLLAIKFDAGKEPVAGPVQ